MLHAGLDLSRRRLEVRVLNDAGDTALETWTPPDRDGLASLVRRVGVFDEPVQGVIEAMNGARFVHDHLEQLGWDIEIADVARSRDWRRWRARPTASTRGCSRSCPAVIWCRRSGCPPRGSGGTGTGPLAVASGPASHWVEEPDAFDPDRVRLPVPGSDLFGVAEPPELEANSSSPNRGTPTWSPPLRSSTSSTPKSSGANATCVAWAPIHRYVELLMTAPGIGWVLGYTIAAEIGDINRFASAKNSRLHRAVSQGRPVRESRPAGHPWPRTARAICAGRSSKPPCTPPSHPALSITTNAPRSPAANSRRKNRPRRDRPQARHRDLAHAHPRQNPSLRQAPITPGRIDGPLPSWATGASHQPNPRLEQAIER